MTRSSHHAQPDDTTEVLARIGANAAKADAGQQDLGPDMRLLVESGILARLVEFGSEPPALVALLRRIGRASLSVGRLAEGHMNALRLADLYGTEAQRSLVFSSAGTGAIFGVWGAESSPGVTLKPGVAQQVCLAGGKRFCSGLGVVDRVVLTAATENGTQLLLADATDPARADASGWKVSGMRATASGTYDFEDVEAEALGEPGDYEREPYFQGGVWRYAALHVGGLEALAETVRCDLAAKGEAATETQLHRLARLATLAHGARLLVEDAAVQVEAPGAGQAAVSLSLAAREAVERACLDGIAIADRALGTRAFAEDGLPDRMRRDLGLFLRQADLDGKLSQVGRTLCASDLPIGKVWGDPC